MPVEAPEPVEAAKDVEMVEEPKEAAEPKDAEMAEEPAEAEEEDIEMEEEPLSDGTVTTLHEPDQELVDRFHSIIKLNIPDKEKRARYL